MEPRVPDDSETVPILEWPVAPAPHACLPACLPALQVGREILARGLLGQTEGERAGEVGEGSRTAPLRSCRQEPFPNGSNYCLWKLEVPGDPGAGPSPQGVPRHRGDPSGLSLTSCQVPNAFQSPPLACPSHSCQMCLLFPQEAREVGPSL